MSERSKNCVHFAQVALRQFVLQELQASPASQAVIFSVVSVLPWNLKFCAAFLSDTFPICGRRRIPYMVFGLCGQAVCWSLLATLPGSEGLTAGLVFSQIVSCMIMCVMLDTMTVEAMNLYVLSPFNNNKQGRHLRIIQNPGASFWPAEKFSRQS